MAVSATNPFMRSVIERFTETKRRPPDSNLEICDFLVDVALEGYYENAGLKIVEIIQRVNGRLTPLVEELRRIN